MKFNMNITRRQFLQYCTASAAALGLSQTDLLKLEQAMATPQFGSGSPTTSVIWMSGQNCSGCQTSLLNRVVDVTGGYYDNDLLAGLGVGVAQGTPNDPIPELNYVNDAADLLVGDAVGATVPQITPRANTWAAFDDGYITLEWLTTVQAGAGDINVEHLMNVVDGTGGCQTGPAAGKFILLLDGSIPGSPDAPIPGTPPQRLMYSERYSLAFDNKIYSDGVTKPISWLPYGASVTIADTLRWMINSGNCAAVICIGTCSAYGGIPGASGNRTGAKGYWTISTNPSGTVPHPNSWIYQNQTTFRPGMVRYLNFNPPVINVPGCPPHPDWVVYPVAYFLIHSALPALNAQTKRPRLIYDDNGAFCNMPNGCPNATTKATAPTPGDATKRAAFLGDNGCIQSFGCKGESVFGDCPGRMKNTMDDGTKANWCVGSDLGSSVGHARHPCQGCIQPLFPDGFSRSSFYEPYPA